MIMVAMAVGIVFFTALLILCSLRFKNLQWELEIPFFVMGTFLPPLIPFFIVAFLAFPTGHGKGVKIDLPGYIIIALTISTMAIFVYTLIKWFLDTAREAYEESKETAVP